eukprot:7378989-Prymnesium_polylepis.1
MSTTTRDEPRGCVGRSPKYSSTLAGRPRASIACGSSSGGSAPIVRRSSKAKLPNEMSSSEPPSPGGADGAHLEEALELLEGRLARRVLEGRAEGGRGAHLVEVDGQLDAVAARPQRVGQRDRDARDVQVQQVGHCILLCVRGGPKQAGAARGGRERLERGDDERTFHPSLVAHGAQHEREAEEGEERCQQRRGHPQPDKGDVDIVDGLPRGETKVDGIDDESEDERDIKTKRDEQ